MTGDIVVSLAGGTYPLTQALTLDARDSGTGGHRVIWTAAAGAQPVISGGIPITGWTKTNARLPRTSSQAWNLVGRPKLHTLPTLVDNAFELLDTPGEWYLDRSRNTVYYLPRSGENLVTARVVAPVLETLVSGQGTA